MMIYSLASSDLQSIDQALCRLVPASNRNGPVNLRALAPNQRNQFLQRAAFFPPVEVSPVVNPLKLDVLERSPDRKRQGRVMIQVNPKDVHSFTEMWACHAFPCVLPGSVSAQRGIATGSFSPGTSAGNVYIALASLTSRKSVAGACILSRNAMQLQTDA